ncbi:hypothetical protein [Tardiphaga sp.]|jgi:hypothetical protein|uniref:hypothetical protein n=1 Tax=Tardiphaga sp. TaxID=1926292 RepID=UPI0037DA1108
MLKWLGCTAVAALFAIVQVEPGLAQSAPPAEKAEPAAAAEKPAEKPVAEKPAAAPPAAERSTTDKAATDKPAPDRAASDKATADKPAEKEAVRSPTKPAADKAAAADDEKPKKKKKMTRQQELDHSIDTGTVPARYRSQVPKEYHQFIPFAKQ